MVDISTIALDVPSTLSDLPEECQWRVLYFLVATLPMPLAFTVAISRTRDDRHHFSDILGGSLIGVMAALLSFRLVFSFCPTRLMYIPTMFLRSSGHGTSTGQSSGAYASGAGDDAGEVEDEPLPPVVQEEMPVIA